MNLQRLVYLCHLKNELNRKRRRFYYLMYSPLRHKYDASNQYQKAKTDMKAMTAEMRRMRVEVGARFIWNDGGLIQAIEFDGRRMSQKHFKKMYESEVFEMEFFKADS